MRTPLLMMFVLLIAPLAAQSCYELALQKGQTAYDQNNYAQARKYWEAGKDCPGASANKLNGLIAKTKDSDGDGVVNGRDQCPNEYGKTKTGCPPPPVTDRDEDGTPDTQDACPNTYGPKRFQGCPDRDFDEMPDIKDNCPDEPGPASAQGCPDRDGDGVGDKYDDCPDVAGLKTNKGCPKVDPMADNMVLITGGVFTMGDLFGEGRAEETRHSVTLSDYYLGKTEVTFEDFDAFCTATNRKKPDDSGWGRGKRPVINVDWYDAVEYCNWLSQKERKSPAYAIDKNRQDPNNTNTSDTKKWIVTRITGANGYRLPTEAEWEYAARNGGKKPRFGNGKDLADPVQMNFDASPAYTKDYSVVGEYRGQTVEVASLRSPNALGLHDMSGNVWEWCGDWYGTYPSFADTNPAGPAGGVFRVLRGGSWFSYPQDCRAASRGHSTPTYRNSNFGFRVAASFQ